MAKYINFVVLNSPAECVCAWNSTVRLPFQCKLCYVLTFKVVWQEQKSPFPNLPRSSNWIQLNYIIWHCVCKMNEGRNCGGESSSNISNSTCISDQSRNWACILSWCLRDCKWSPYWVVLIHNHHLMMMSICLFWVASIHAEM